MWWNYGFGWFFPGLFFIPFFLIFWVLVVALLWGIWRRGGSRRWYRGGDGKPAEELLADRFARGEIDEEEYNKRLEVLRTHRR